MDRLIRGRLWIGLLAFALIGIVAMQLLVLKLNTGIGRTLGHVATLQRENAQLNIEDSMYSSENRVAPLATAAGMTLAPAGTVHFVTASMADISRAAAALSTRRSGVRERGVHGEHRRQANPPTGAPAVKPPPRRAAAAEASGSGEDSSSSTAGSTGESTAGSGETQSTSSASSASPPSTGSSAPADSAPSVAGAQAAEAPASSSSSSGAAASTPAGGTQAGTGE